MIGVLRGLRRTIPAALVLGATGCASIGMAAEDVFRPIGGLNNVNGEVRSVDTRRQRITIDLDNRRRQVVQYDGRTQVVYRQQRYPVSALERGDRVSVRVDQDRRGTMTARRIDVRSSPRETAGRNTTGRVQRFDGRVRGVNQNRGTFVLQQNGGRNLTVTLPYNPSRATSDRFRRLRNGDQIRIEAQVLNQNRVEVRRFF